MIVMKFGGTSVKDSQAMLNAAAIVKRESHEKLIVVLSASSGITDSLLRLIKSAPFNPTESSLELIEEIRLRHISIAEETIKNTSLRDLTSRNIELLSMELIRLVEGVNLLGECTPKSLDAAVSFGELLSTSVFTGICLEKGVNAVLTDARSFMITDANFEGANVNFDKIKEKSCGILLPLLEEGKVIITQGFIGSDEHARTTTLGRGGSDYSAALIGAALNAEEIQIWTDVPGVMTADPRIVPTAKTNKHLTISEVRELSFFGAKVLHADTIKPAIDEKIPVKVLGTGHPDHAGTIILHRCLFDHPKIRTFILIDNIFSISETVSHKNDSYQNFQNLIGKIKRSNIKIFASGASETKYFILTENLPDIDFSDEMKIETLSVLCLCGINLFRESAETSKILIKLTIALKDYDYRGFFFGMNTNSIIILLKDKNGKEILKKLHDEFID